MEKNWNLIIVVECSLDKYKIIVKYKRRTKKVVKFLNIRTLAKKGVYLFANIFRIIRGRAISWVNSERLLKLRWKFPPRNYFNIYICFYCWRMNSADKIFQIFQKKFTLIKIYITGGLEWWFLRLIVEKLIYIIHCFMVLKIKVFFY